MAILPDKDLAQIQFCETHQPVWAVAPATIGVTAAACSTLDTQTKAARAAFKAAAGVSGVLVAKVKTAA